MMQGSTPTHIFRLPIDTNLIQSLRITYAQNERKVLTKTKKDCVLDGNAVTVKLTQEETLLFKAKLDAEIQIHILTVGGDSIPSIIKKVPVRLLLDREVLE